MRMVIHGKQMDIPADLKAIAEAKLGKLDRHLDNIIEIEVEMSHLQTRSNDQSYVVQITLLAGGTRLRSQEYASNAAAALDMALEKIDRQVSRYKGKLYGKKNKTGLSALAASNLADTAREEREIDQENDHRSPNLKVKRFEVKPMFADEAIEEMELLGHDFYAFLNAESEQVNVIYRRGENRYGILVPEIS